MTSLEEMERAYRERLLSQPRFCTRCGRQLELVLDRKRKYRSDTGEMYREEWLQCPKFGFFGPLHDSRSTTNPLLGRTYR